MAIELTLNHMIRIRLQPVHIFFDFLCLIAPILFLKPPSLLPPQREVDLHRQPRYQSYPTYHHYQVCSRSISSYAVLTSFIVSDFSDSDVSIETTGGRASAGWSEVSNCLAFNV